MVKFHIPEQGDIVYINFNPQKGHEQAGKRPALTLSPKKYNQAVGLGIFCPITSKGKGYPFEVRLPKKLKTNGVVLSDHIRNLDWDSRGIEFVEKAPSGIVDTVLQKLGILFAG